MRHGHSFICSTGEAGSVSSTSDSTSDSTPASIAAQLAPQLRRMSDSLAARLQPCKSACCQSAITGSKATSSSISHEASEKRNRTASQQHTLIQYRDECVFSCMFSSLYCVRICICILKHCVRGVSPCDPFVARGNAQIQEVKGLFSFPKRYASPQALYM